MTKPVKPGRPRSPGLSFFSPRVILPGALVLGVLAVSPVFRMFVVETVPDRRVVFLRPFAPGYEFFLSYTHSVNKSEIIDRFGLREDGSVILRGSRFLSFGAGVATEDAGTFSGTDRFLEYRGMDRELPDLRVFIGGEADHRYASRDGSFRFLDRVAPRTGLSFHVRRVSPVEMISYRARKGVLHETGD